MHTPPHVMTAMLLTRHGGTEALQYRTDVPVPVPGAGEVLIRVGASSVNNTDIATRLGWYGGDQQGGWRGGLAFPRIQGADVCGVIAATGPGVDPARLGQRVLVQPCLVSLRQAGIDVWLGSERDGGFAQYVTAPAADTHAINSTLTDAELACLPCAYGTAENLLRRTAVAAGETVLITGASGGVGSAAVQLAKARGATVLAVVSAAKMQAAAALGADHVIAREVRVSAVLAANSINVVIDVAGGPAWPDLIELLAPGGRYAVSGAIAGPLVQLDLRRLYLKDLTLLGCTAQSRAGFVDLIRTIEAGHIRPLLAGIFALAALAQAQTQFAEKRHTGKLAVIPPQD